MESKPKKRSPPSAHRTVREMSLSASISQHAKKHPVFAAEMIDVCLSEAIQKRASDVHLQPRRDGWEVYYRLDGVLQLASTFPHDEKTNPVARLMSLAKLPSYMGGIPQEGSFQWNDDRNQSHELRLGIFPTLYGNRAAIRIMGEAGSVFKTHELGIDEKTESRLKRVCESRDGWLLVAGPAGSGKTTTLYACLQHIALGHENRSVLTIEDPIESVIESISQSQLQPNSGLTLASAMRSAVRQDAEVLLVSEIRDAETAETVLSASMTGHLCFSSIHSGSLGSTLRRLVQMKLPTYAIQTGLRGIVCQRLLRATCKQCDGKSQTEHRCDACHGTGYQGRIPVVQLTEFDGSDFSCRVFDRLECGATADEIDGLVHESGRPSLRDLAMELVTAGITDAAEVFRVLGSNG